MAVKMFFWHQGCSNGVRQSTGDPADLRFNRDFTRIYFFEMHYMKCWNYVIEKKFFLENKKDDIQDGMNYQIKGLQKPY